MCSTIETRIRERMNKRNLTIPVRGFGLALVLTIVSFCLRTDNYLFVSFEARDLTICLFTAFIVSIIMGTLMGFIKKPSSKTISMIASTFCILASFALAYLVTQTTRFSESLSLGSGFFLGFGIALALFQWYNALSQSSAAEIAFNVVIALVFASLLSFGFMFLTSTTLLFVALTSCALASTALYLLCSFQNLDESKQEKQPFPSVALADNKRILAFGFGGIAGLGFNFFTLGLTFWPDWAGVQSGSPQPTKIIAYAFVLVSFALVYALSRKNFNAALELSYRIALPIAAAIVLASPFLEFFQNIEWGVILATFSYFGIALFNILGLVAMLWICSYSKLGSAKTILFSTITFCLSMIAGMIIFQLFGKQAQFISLCVVSAYFVVLMIVTIRDNSINEAETGQHALDRLSSIVDTLSQRYALSPREKEILVFLAKGRGSKYIANKLKISPETVRTHSKRIYEKMSVHNKEDLLDIIESCE